MSLVECPDYTKYLVLTNKLEVVEYCYNAEVDITQKSKNCKVVCDVSRVLCGLLNTCGGRVRLHLKAKDGVKHLRMNDWMESFVKRLQLFIPECVFLTCIRITASLTTVTVSVAPSSTLIALKFHIHTRVYDVNIALTDPVTVYNVMQQKSAKAKQCPVGAREFQYKYGDVLSQRENYRTEYKCWETDNIMNYIQTPKDGTKRGQHSLFAFANSPYGGDIIIGVKDDMTIVGQEISLDDEENFRTHVSEVLREKQDSGKTKRIWGNEDYEPQHGTDWNMEFIPVKGNPIHTRSRLIKIHINHKEGGVFESLPEVYEISDEGYLKQMSFTSMKNMLQRSVCPQSCKACMQPNSNRSQKSHSASDLPPRTTMAENVETIPEEVTETDDTSVDPPTILRPHPSPRGTSPLQTIRIRTDSEHLKEGDINEGLKKKKYLSWQENRENWEQNVSLTSMELDMSIQIFLSDEKVMHPSNPINLTPCEESVFAVEPRMRACIDEINKEIGPDMKGFGIVTRQWNLMFSHQLDKTKEQRSNIMDIFVMAENCKLILCSVLLTSDVKVDAEREWTYLVQFGRLTNKKLCEKMIGTKKKKVPTATLR